MLEMYRALFVDPSLETLLPIVGMVIVGVVLSTIRRIARIGVTILIVGIVALGLYFAWKAEMIQPLLDQVTGLFPS